MNREGILVIGSANMDLVISTERFPNPGETIFGKNFDMFKRALAFALSNGAEIDKANHLANISCIALYYENGCTKFNAQIRRN